MRFMILVGEFGVWDDWDCDKDKQGAAIVRDWVSDRYNLPSSWLKLRLRLRLRLNLNLRVCDSGYWGYGVDFEIVLE